MGRIHIETRINAPIEVVFDLARDVDAHAESTQATKERIVGGRLSGLLELGDEVTFEAVHLGVRQRLTSKIIEMDRPYRFVDEMQKGAFKSLRHIHAFSEADGVTTMTDELVFRAPLGPLGWIAERVFLDRYLTRFLRERCEALKSMAEQASRA
ncbi:MAG: SRPBCC family protein [Armatimonadetes bacterium]|nr:SRPBCC family protein [Armatimonadota bacterium]